MPEFIDHVFVKTSQKRSFSITENEHFWLVFTKTGSINSGKDDEFVQANKRDMRCMRLEGYMSTRRIQETCGEK